MEFLVLQKVEILSNSYISNFDKTKTRCLEMINIQVQAAGKGIVQCSQITHTPKSKL